VKYNVNCSTVNKVGFTFIIVLCKLCTTHPIYLLVICVCVVPMNIVKSLHIYFDLLYSWILLIRF